MSGKAWSPIIARAADIVREYDTPVTLRQLHYRLVAEAEATDSGYTKKQTDYGNLSRLSAAARRAGDFPPLLDYTRTVDRAQTFTSPADALDVLAQVYRRDLLDTQETSSNHDITCAISVAFSTTTTGAYCRSAPAATGGRARRRAGRGCTNTVIPSGCGCGSWPGAAPK